jgi:alpha-beta hydrolase superfamily lysophospholipase
MAVYPKEVQVIDPRIEPLTRLTSRYLASGVAFGDIQTAIAQSTDCKSWSEAWTVLANEHGQNAVSAKDKGHSQTASAEIYQAAILLHFGWYLSLDDMDAYENAMLQSRNWYLDALSWRGDHWESVDFTFDGHTYFAILRVPHDPPRALVVLIPGLDATAVELHPLAGSFLSRGIATITVDGPGQGASRAFSRMEPSFERPFSSLMDRLSGRFSPNVPIGAVGVSLGGYYAPRAAAFDSRISAAVAVCGPVNYGRVLEAGPQSPLQLEALRSGVGAASMEETKRLAYRFDLTEIASKITVPLLVVHAAQDRVIPASEAIELANFVKGSELRIYDRADHVCHNMAESFRLSVTDWIEDHLVAA